MYPLKDTGEGPRLLHSVATVPSNKPPPPLKPFLARFARSTDMPPTPRTLVCAGVP